MGFPGAGTARGANETEGGEAARMASPAQERPAGANETKEGTRRWKK